MSLSLHEARAKVIAEVGRRIGDGAGLATEEIPLAAAADRVLAREVRADRDQPPFDRSTRDGFAVRSLDVAGASRAAVALTVVGEVAAGGNYSGVIAPGSCVEIMTGAPVPDGADAVVMVEHTQRPSPAQVLIERAAAAGENIVPRGSELVAGATALQPGQRLDPASVALLASLGCARPTVFARPRVAIVATGDELVSLDGVPAPTQIRDSNRYSLAAQVVRAGGFPLARPILRDDPAALRVGLAEAFTLADLVLVSGGVSMGKYDFVEGALAELGAQVVFDGVDIRPGRPLVFGFVGVKPFFGLPGNPLSTLVTFELFGRPALALLGGHRTSPLQLTAGRLAADYAQRKLMLTSFVPVAFESVDGGACLEPVRVRPLSSQGSGDLAAMAGADALMVVPAGIATMTAGSVVSLLPK